MENQRKSLILTKKRYFSKTGLKMSKIHQGFTVKVTWGRKGALFSKKCAFCAKVHISAISSTFAKKQFLREKCGILLFLRPMRKTVLLSERYCLFLHFSAKSAYFRKICTFCAKVHFLRKVLFSRKSAIFTKKCNFSEMDPKMNKIHQGFTVFCARARNHHFFSENS